MPQPHDDSGALSLKWQGTVFHRPAIAVPSLPHLFNHVRSSVRSDLDLHVITSTSQTRWMLLVWRRRRYEEFETECKKPPIVCTC